MGNFKKQNFDAPTRRVGMLRGDQVGVQPSVYAWYRFADIKNGYGRFWNCCAKRGAQCFWFKRSFAMPTSKTASCFCWVLFDSA